jgi:hypothetical protein
MKTTTLLASLAVIGATLAALVATCSGPPARKPERAATPTVAPAQALPIQGRQEPVVTAATTASGVPERRSAPPNSICDCVDGTVCVENAPKPPPPGPSPGECRATPARAGKACQGLQVYDEICGGCVPAPCAGRCRQQQQTSPGVCQVRPEGCDPVDCECFNPCAPLRCNVVGAPAHIRCTKD